MKRINTIMILGIITILEIVGDTIVASINDIGYKGIISMELDSITLWILYGIYKVITHKDVEIEFGDGEDGKKE